MALSYTWNRGGSPRRASRVLRPQGPQDRGEHRPPRHRGFGGLGDRRQALQGLVERRDKGGLFKTDYRLYEGGRDRTRVIEGLGWQVSAVRSALGSSEVTVNAAVCFIEAEWKLFAKPFQLGGVWVTWGTKLAEMIAAPGPLSLAEVTSTAERLAAALPPAVSEPRP